MIYGDIYKKVGLDTGHDKHEAGKRSPWWVEPDGTKWQLREYIYTRDLAEVAAVALDKLGIKSIILPGTDEYVSLSNRVKMVNELHSKEKMILQSLHGNAHGNGDQGTPASGFEIWSHPNASKTSKVMGTAIFNEFEKWGKFKMRSCMQDGYPDKEARHTINTVNCPSNLCEFGFYTNEKECRYMMSWKGLNEVAAQFSIGLDKFLNTKVV